MTGTTTTTVLWFRLNLRLHDNEALHRATSLLAAPGVAQRLLPVFTLDPAATPRRGVRPWIFLLESLRDLDASLRARGSRLIILRGDPLRTLPVCLRAVGASRLVTMRCAVDAATARLDRAVQLACGEAGVDYTITNGYTLYPIDTILHRNKGKPPLTYQRFLKVVDGIPAQQGLRAGPFAAPQALPELPPLEPLEDALRRAGEASRGGPGSPMGADMELPNLRELGLEEPPPGERSPHRGGETVGREVLKKYMSDAARVAKFEKPNTSPAAFKPADTTVLSPHVTFGTVSIWEFYHEVQEIYRKVKNHSKPPVSLMGQLLWRDFYYVVASATPNYERMDGNKVCLTVDWWCALGPTDPVNPTATANLEAWKNGKTGFPWIDAIMNQLRLEGWIHHLARHSVACFLTRGDLFISWERGAEVFEELLLDHDHALNVGNWLWLSASAFFQQYFRVYSPVAFGKKHDKLGKYIRKYVPALKNMPTEHIHAPWLAPKETLQRAGVVLGENYPRPIVDHEVASVANIALMKAAYERGVRGGVAPLPAVHAVAGAVRPREEERDDDAEEEEDEEAEEEKAPRKRRAARR